MKRLLSIVLILTIVLSLLTGFASADITVYITKTGTKYHNDGCKHLSSSKIAISLTEAINRGYQPCADCHAPTGPAAHTHTWDAGKVTTAATCVSTGVRTYTCTVCGATKTETIPATGNHTWDAGKVTTAATCVKTGVRTYTCTVCGATKTETIQIDPNAHVWTCTKIWTAPEDDRHGYGLFVCSLCAEAKTDEICPSAQFSDVSNDWANRGIDYAVTNGLMNGVGNNRFAPNDPMTRGMLVTVLWRFEGSPKEGANTFADVKAGDWFADAVAWAAENEIVNGVGGGKFAPNGNITREQMATILYRYASRKDYDTSARGSVGGFPDARQIDGWAQDAIGWAVGAGLINGSDGKLLPLGNATRAQVATILMRFIENITRN